MAKSIHFWSGSKYPWISSKDTADLHGECLLLQELQRLQKTYELLSKLCVMLTLYAVTFQVKSFETAGIALPTPIIQITLFERPPKLPPSQIVKSQEKINFLHSQQKSNAGELVAGILKTHTPLSSTFSKSYELF